MDDPELLRYPVAYLSEPATGSRRTRGRGLRTWLAKGGFLIVDDFTAQPVAQLRALDAQGAARTRSIVPLDVSHPIFDSFFRITTLDGMTHPDNRDAARPSTTGSSRTTTRRSG